MLDASGIIHVSDDRFLVAEDETDILRFFQLNQQQLSFTATGNNLHMGHAESDFESLAYDPDNQFYYCIGSHGEDYSKRLISFQLDKDKISHHIEIPFDAEHLINQDVNIEALSLWGSKLFIGYRSPDFNQAALAVLFDVNNGTQLLTSFNLAGRTFRDIVRIDSQNYLILAGPQRGKHYATLPSQVIWWNGDIFAPRLEQCQVDLAGYRAEGIAVRSNKNGSLDILLGSDESKVNSARSFRMLMVNVADIPGLINQKHKLSELKVVL